MNKNLTNFSRNCDSLSLSIVIPCYNEATSVEIFYNEVKKNIRKNQNKFRSKTNIRIYLYR